MATHTDLQTITQLAAQLWVSATRCSSAAVSGHPTSSLSAADLMAVLLSDLLRCDRSAPDRSTNDHPVFSKGHASLLRCAMSRASGAIGGEKLLTTYRHFESRVQGLPTPALPRMDVAIGSFGQGLPCAVGIALAGKYLEKLPFHVWVFCDDSEMAEGSMREALDKAGCYRLANLTEIVDVNRADQRGPTELGCDLDTYRQRAEAFGCRALLIDGCDVAIDAATAVCRADAELVCVLIARSVKACGVEELEDAEGWCARTLPAELAGRAVAAPGGAGPITVTSPPPPPPSSREAARPGAISPPRYELGALGATRHALGDALEARAGRPDVVVLDGEIANSTYTDEFAAACPERFFEMFIPEQQMIGAAVGLEARGGTPFTSRFAAFVSLRADCIRMAAISGVCVCINGSHAGVEMGVDGAHRMGLEDLAQVGISGRVIDTYSVKPIDYSTRLEACEVTGGRLVVARRTPPRGRAGRGRGARPLYRPGSEPNDRPSGRGRCHVGDERGSDLGPPPQRCRARPSGKELAHVRSVRCVVVPAMVDETDKEARWVDLGVHVDPNEPVRVRSR